MHDIINESLSDPLEWEWHMDGYATFTSPTGIPYHVMIRQIRRNQYFFGFDVKDHVDGMMTRENRALQILATIIDILNDFVVITPNVESVFFYSRIEEKSRIAAYRSLLRRFAIRHDFTFTEKDENIGVDVIKFTIERN